MRIQLFNVMERRRFKAAERAADRAAAQHGREDQRQERNRFIPNARDWDIETVPEPMRGEVLE
jgi:hypothetical protein